MPNHEVLISEPHVSLRCMQARDADALTLETHFDSLKMDVAIPQLALACLTTACWNICLAAPAASHPSGKLTVDLATFRR